MAGAPMKKGLDYFRLDTAIGQDPKIELLEAEFGLKGFALVIKLLIRIYGDEGYFMRWNSDTQLLLAKRIGERGGFIGEVVKGAVRRGFFHKTVFDNFGILTSAAIQKRYFDAIKRRERVDVVREYLLVEISDYSNNIHVIINSINDDRNPQRRAEQSRPEKSREVKGPGKKTKARGNNQRIEPPDDADKVAEIGRMRGIPPEQCEIYFHLRATDQFLRRDKDGNWKPILNWHSDLYHLYRKGALEPGKPMNGNKRIANDKQTRKSRGQNAVEFLSR